MSAETHGIGDAICADDCGVISTAPTRKRLPTSLFQNNSPINLPLMATLFTFYTPSIFHILRPGQERGFWPYPVRIQFRIVFQRNHDAGVRANSKFQGLADLLSLRDHNFPPVISRWVLKGSPQLDISGNNIIP